ncbi:MAG: BCAM0308 family protein [Immundisolibacter sp.]|uniref:BCAM0308 family protein n=1 Tax=Immundisolibacter sp. TaxID=1934948 RepID=UPI003566D1CE
MTGSHKTPDAPHHGRHDRPGMQQIHDPYVARQKLSEPSACRECGVVWHKGRWQWLSRPPGAHDVLCPACARVRDRVPAGYLTVVGDFLEGHLDEVLSLIHNHEAREKSEHPLQRIMATEGAEGGGLLITTSDAHLARGLGEALHHAYRGELDYHYVEDEATLRVHWQRD